MWYLQANTFLLIAVFSLAAALLRKLLPGKAFNILLPVLELAVIASISLYLALLYAVYIIAGAAFSGILYKFRSKALFVLFSVTAAIPFFIGRLEAFGTAAPSWFVGIGMAFAMLKQIDLYYYVYYSGEPVRPLVFVNYMLFLPVFTAGPKIGRAHV
jgi:hypothetical protein